MSKVAIQGNASGTGTFTIAAPNSNTDRTLTLPDEAGTVLTSASSIVPSAVSGFSARLSANQSIPHNTTVKLQYDSEDFDIASEYDNTTNYRFTPQTAGYYKVNLWQTMQSQNGNSGIYTALELKKNGSTEVYIVQSMNTVIGQEMSSGINHIMYFNGSTDYIEAYMYQYDYYDYNANNAYGSNKGVFSAWLLGA